MSQEESRWQRGMRMGREYWRDAVWPAMKVCALLSVIVLLVLFVVGGD